LPRRLSGSATGKAFPFILDANPKGLVRVAKEFEFEGIVAKREVIREQICKSTNGDS
jgi:hypothetical protein